MAKNKLTPEQEADNIFTQHRFDNQPAPGYTTSVEVQNTGRGPIITFVSVGLAPTPLDEHNDKFPWYSDSSTLTAGQNEAGVTARILKQLNLTDVKQKVVEQLIEGGESGYLPLDIAVEQIKEGLSGRTQVRDKKFNATLANAYVRQVAKTGSKGVYDELGAKLGYSPHTLRSYVKELRVDGYLTPAVPGVAGGDLTNKSRNVLGLKVGA